MILNIPDLGLGGLNSDVTPWDLPPEMITSGLNFRIDGNAVVTYGGHALLKAAKDDFSPAYGILVPTKTGTFIVFTGQDKIMSFHTDFRDISGDIGAGDDIVVDEWLWSGCLNGSVAILNNSNVYPVYWYGEGDAIPLPWNIASDGQGGTITTTWKDIGYTAGVIRAHKNFLIAMDLTDSIHRPDSFRWSHPADENGIPFTWDPQNTSGLAGIQPLGGDGGRIIDGLTLRDSFVIYSQKAINILDLSGDEFVWRRRELSTTVGLISKDCVVEVKGMHYLMTRGDIVTFDGNSIQSIAHDRIQTRLKRINTDFIDRSFVFSNDKNKEIWFCIPEDLNETPSIAFIYQWKQGTWSIRDLPDNTGFILSAPEIHDTGEAWDYYIDGVLDPSVWNDDLTRWSDDVSAVTFEEHPYAVNHGNSELHLLDTSDPIEDLNFYIEKTDLAIEGQVSITTLTRIYPHIQGTKPLQIRVGSQDRPGAEVRWKPYKDFNPSPGSGDRKVDVRTTGALHSYSIRSTGKNAFRVAGVDIEYEVDGIR